MLFVFYFGNGSCLGKEIRIFAYWAYCFERDSPLFILKPDFYKKNMEKIMFKNLNLRFFTYKDDF